MFIDAFLALGSSPGAGLFAELTAAGYTRQPMAFADAVAGVCYNSITWTFGQAIRGFSARALFDAPTGGNLLLVMPFPTQPAPRLPWDTGDVSDLRLVFTALIPFRRGAAYVGGVAAGAVCGTTNDRWDVVNPIGIISGGGSDGFHPPPNPVPVINTAPLSAGVALSINRGILQPLSDVP